VLTNHSPPSTITLGLDAIVLLPQILVNHQATKTISGLQLMVIFPATRDISTSTQRGGESSNQPHREQVSDNFAYFLKGVKPLWKRNFQHISETTERKLRNRSRRIFDRPVRNRWSPRARGRGLPLARIVATEATDSLPCVAGVWKGREREF